MKKSAIPKKTLNIKRTTLEEVEKNWGNGLFPMMYRKGNIFIRCNAKGQVNWDKALLYSESELATRKTKIFS